jgi:hypothetical protein
MKHDDSWRLAAAMLGLLGPLGSGCVLKGAMLDDEAEAQGDDDLGSDGGSDSDSGEWGGDDNADAETMGPDPEPDPDECLTFGSNVDGSTTPPAWALYPEYDVTCASGFGHEQLRLEPIVWTSTIEGEALGLDEVVDPLVGATLDGGALVVIAAEDDLPQLARFSATGEQVWTAPFEALGIGFPSDMVGHDDRFHVGTSHPEGARLVAIDEAGDVLWLRDFVGVALGGLTTTDQGVAATLLAADLETTTLTSFDLLGEPLWSVESPVAGGWALTRLPDGDLFVAGADGWARHDPDGTLKASESWSFNWLSIAAGVSEGRLFVAGTIGVGEASQISLVTFEGDDSSLFQVDEVEYDRASSWVAAGDPLDPETATYETSLAMVAMADGVVLLGTEVAFATDFWTPWLLHADASGEGAGIDRGFWEGEASHGAAGPGNALFVVFANPSEPTQIHLRKYQL